MENIMESLIYLDNAATTQIDSAVNEAMKPYLQEQYANAASVYQFAQQSRKALDEAREIIAQSIGALHANEIYFTNGGSESDNWAIKGAAFALREKGNHIITTKIEHHAVLNTCAFLEKLGYEVTYLDVDETGRISLSALEQAIRPSTILISVMTANNEIGTIQPVAAIGAIAKSYGILFHTDAVQAYGHIPIAVQEAGIDLLSASAHKFHGPKGTGFLYIRNGVRLEPLIHGGAQERSQRAGTHNVAGIVGMAKASQIAFANREIKEEKIKKLRDYFIKRILAEIPYTIVNGDIKHRLANNVNICFPFLEGESLLIMLDQKGICVSSGSACTSGSLAPSHVLLALGLSEKMAKSALRFTLSEKNTWEEIDYVVDVLKEIKQKNGE